MELTRDELLVLYHLMKKMEEELTPSQYCVLLKLQKELYQYYTIEEMEKINERCGGLNEC